MYKYYINHKNEGIFLNKYVFMDVRNVQEIYLMFAAERELCQENTSLHARCILQQKFIYSMHALIRLQACENF